MLLRKLRSTYRFLCPRYLRLKKHEPVEKQPFPVLKDGLKKPLIEKQSPVNTGLPDRKLVKKWAFSEFP